MEHNRTQNRSAVVLLSGGQDSGTCLHWALDRYASVRALTYDYSQRHAVELECASDLARKAGVAHDTLEVSAFDELDAETSGMLDGGDAIADTGHDLDDDLPTTFLPGRNLVLLTAATAYALRHGVRDVVTGVCQTDYSGYPDCRATTIGALQTALRLGTGQDDVRLVTPLMRRSKAETWELADALGVVDVIREDTHTCYRGERDDLHDWGYGCGDCPACELRAQGYFDFQNQRSDG